MDFGKIRNNNINKKYSENNLNIFSVPVSNTNVANTNITNTNVTNTLTTTKNKPKNNKQPTMFLNNNRKRNNLGANTSIPANIQVTSNNINKSTTNKVNNKSTTNTTTSRNNNTKNTNNSSNLNKNVTRTTNTNRVMNNNNNRNRNNNTNNNRNNNNRNNNNRNNNTNNNRNNNSNNNNASNAANNNTSNNTNSKSLSDYFDIKILYTIFNIFIVIILFIVIYMFGKYLIKKYIQNRLSVPLLKGVKDANKAYVISQDPTSTSYIPIKRSNDQDGLEFSYSAWIYVNELNNEKEKQHIFHKGNNKAYPIMCPAVYLENGNNISVHMNTLQDIDEKLVIPSIPINKWICLTITVHNHNLDVYINGYLKDRKVLKSLPRQNNDNFWCNMNGGYDGYISNIIYYPYTLGLDEIIDIVESGPAKSKCLVEDDKPPYLNKSWFF